MEQFEGLYDKLFRSKDPESYTGCLQEIAEAIQLIEVGIYKPAELKLRVACFPGPCEAYVCIKGHNVLDRDGRIAASYMLGSVLTRQKQWDRDQYLNSFPLNEYVAGGPLEDAERQVCWFPIYLPKDLRKAIDFMLEMHRAYLIDYLSAPQEGFL